MRRDIGDIIDRWSISKLKMERIGNPENKREYEAFCLSLKDSMQKEPDFDWDGFTNLVLDINNFIWQLESGLKGGKEELTDPNYILSNANSKALSKIGATTILIRNFNHLRVKVKNMINKQLEQGFQDIKKEHLSE